MAQGNAICGRSIAFRMLFVGDVGVRERFKKFYKPFPAEITLTCQIPVLPPQVSHGDGNLLVPQGFCFLVEPCIDFRWIWDHDTLEAKRLFRLSTGLGVFLLMLYIKVTVLENLKSGHENQIASAEYCAVSCRFSKFNFPIPVPLHVCVSWLSQDQHWSLTDMSVHSKHIT